MGKVNCQTSESIIELYSKDTYYYGYTSLFYMYLFELYCPGAQITFTSVYDSNLNFTTPSNGSSNYYLYLRNAGTNKGKYGVIIGSFSDNSNIKKFYFSELEGNGMRVKAKSTKNDCSIVVWGIF